MYIQKSVRCFVILLSDISLNSYKTVVLINLFDIQLVFEYVLYPVSFLSNTICFFLHGGLFHGPPVLNIQVQR